MAKWLFKIARWCQTGAIEFWISSRRAKFFIHQALPAVICDLCMLNQDCVWMVDWSSCLSDRNCDMTENIFTFRFRFPFVETMNASLTPNINVAHDSGPACTQEGESFNRWTYAQLGAVITQILGHFPGPRPAPSEGCRRTSLATEIDSWHFMQAKLKWCFTQSFWPVQAHPILSVENQIWYLWAITKTSVLFGLKKFSQMRCAILWRKILFTLDDDLTILFRKLSFDNAHTSLEPGGCEKLRQPRMESGSCTIDWGDV